MRSPIESHRLRIHRFHIYQNGIHYVCNERTRTPLIFYMKKMHPFLSI